MERTMADLDLMRELTREQGGKIILLVMDGLGGLPKEPDGPTELEAARTPNMDRLAHEGSTGLSIPVARGITPGSGPAHLAMFGYDPLKFRIGRGVLEAVGIGLEVGENDVAVRGNFCTVDENGLITDRRAGRIPTEKGAEACKSLREISLPGVRLTVEPVKEYRFAVILHGEGLSDEVDDTDPQMTGVAPLPARPLADTEAARRTADLANQFAAQAAERLRGHHPANMVTLRGFSEDPKLPKYADVYKLRAACVAVYPMYKGVSRLVGMDVIETDANDTPADEFERVARIWDDYDFVFCHIKPTDSRGEDGNFEAKVKVIEVVDAALPRLLDLKPDVLIVTGDHSTPATWRSHSWHPVPLLLWAPATHMPDRVEVFGERACMNGALGHFHATDMMPLALAHAGRLEKYGA
jgi:2,3-bisphosphoglycerate-independent phosphoglycerate mutase